MSEFNLQGFDLFGEPIKPKNQGPIAEKFTFPPFSILDARQGEWQERKRQWTSIGIKSEVGRDASVIHCPTANNDEGLTDANYTSIFDPVLCELAYRWFSPKDGQIVDPFAGGSVRGIIAGALGRKYWGCDLRQEQIDANIEQKQELFPNANIEWVCGDSNVMLNQAPEADLIFSCPPYGDLEVYSDHPADISNMKYDEFKKAYRSIIYQSVKRLKNNRFACFVVGDFRNKKGFYNNFVSDTIDAFNSAGAFLYNEAILVTSVGSASMRVSKQFVSGRKFAKTHQNVLVFCKGDWKEASTVCEHGFI